MKNIYLIIVKATICLFGCLSLIAQEYQLPLWPEGVPNQLKSAQKEQLSKKDIIRISNVQDPQIEVYLPVKKNANGQAILVCPGGGYGGLSYDWEGIDIAKWLNSLGVAGIVLKYRLPSPESQPEPNKAPLQDARQAMRLIRKNANSWNIDASKVGVMGFSAGGHLASTLGTHIDSLQQDDIPSRPNFMILVYPVISMSEDITHKGSRNNLIGKEPSSEMIAYYSNEQRVTEKTPPTFLVHSMDDKAVPVENSIRFYESLNKLQIPSEMHLYPHGGHGYSLALEKGHLKEWTKLLSEWLSSLN